MNDNVIRFARFFSQLDYPTRQSALAYLNAVDDNVSGEEDSDYTDVSSEFRSINHHKKKNNH